MFHGIPFIILGNFILACGVAFFIVPDQILTGGVAGLAVIFAPIINVSETFLINVLTYILFIIGTIFLGKKFAFKTLLSTVLYPVFVTVLTQMTSKMYITSNPMLATIYGGVCVGVGVGLVFKTGASTGGMDIPPLIIHKYTHIKLSTLVLITDSLTVLLGATLRGVEPALIGIISVYLSAVMIDRTMMIGMDQSKSLMIISDENEKILDRVMKELNRGATLLKAQGGFTKDDKDVLMLVISKNQFPVVNRMIQEIDPSAFVIVNDVNEVQGEGFTFDEPE